MIAVLAWRGKITLLVADIYEETQDPRL
jgi:hypothetical protein